MNILITGATGFIAKVIIQRLKREKHTIHTCRQLRFTENTQPDCWLHVLKGIDIVINCVGVFQTNKKHMWDIHYHAPKALFEACEQIGIKQIIQISALGIDKIDTPYAKSKLAAEQCLQELSINTTIIRPSFVYGSNCYGGSAFFRGLAGIPWITPLPGKATQKLQPVHIDDLANIVSQCLNLAGKHCIPAAGPEKLSMQQVLKKLQSWLGFKRTLCIPVPLVFIKLGAKLGDFIKNSPISSSGIKMMAVDNTISDGEYQNMISTTGITPRGFSDGLARMQSSIQDRWHARLFFLKPLLRFCLAFIWIFTGLVSAFFYPHSASYQLLSAFHIPTHLQALTLYGASALDIVLGLALAFNYRIALIAGLQCLMIVAYTILISCVLPSFWLHPFAPVAKNIPLLAATLVMMALEPSR